MRRAICSQTRARPQLRARPASTSSSLSPPNILRWGRPWYVGCSQSQSSSDTLNLMATADGNAGFLTQIYTGQTYGTVPSTIVHLTACTTLQGPYFAFY